MIQRLHRAVLAVGACGLALAAAVRASSQPAGPSATPPAAPQQRDLGDTVAFDPDAGAPKGMCGAERWSVKTLSDPDAGKVKAGAPQNATVDSLIHNPADSPWPKDEPGKHTLPPDVRFVGGAYDESAVYQVHANLVGYKFEADKDVHIVLSDPNDARETMIVEIVDPACPGASASSFAPTFQAVRERFGKLFTAQPLAPDQFLTLPKPVPVVVQGARFFDHLHGQTGVAPNGVELHPVLAIDKDGP